MGTRNNNHQLFPSDEVKFHGNFMAFKDSSALSHFIFEINVGKSRIRHTTTLKLKNELIDRLKID